MSDDLSTLYLRDTYTDKSIIYKVNIPIIEYDLKSANTSLCREYKLLPMKKIKEIENMDKKKRVRTIGVISRDDKEFKENLKKSFVDIRRRFFFDNDIKDEDIIAIKKDAIFTCREVDKQDFGDCHFITKNQYTGFLRIDQFEFYYSERFGTIVLDVKGLNDLNLSYHENYTLKFIRQWFHYIMFETPEGISRFLSKFITKYKTRELPLGYYREFNHASTFVMNDSDETYSDEIFIPYMDRENHVDISFNFFNIVLPIAKYTIDSHCGTELYV